MSLEFLIQVSETLALGAGEPTALRASLRSALAESGVDLPGLELPPLDDEDHTLLVFVDDYAGQATLTLFHDSALSEATIADLERVNGLAACGPDELGAGAELWAFVRVLSIAGVDPDLDGWFTNEDRGDPGCPSKAELESLAGQSSVASIVLDGDGTVWRHSPRPPADLLAHSLRRVISLRLAM
jgi:hypothetical protein